MDGRCNVGHSISNDNGRDGGGKAGREHRYSFPAVDDERWDEAKAGSINPGRFAGEIGEITPHAKLNTMASPARGQIVGPEVPTPPKNGFKK